MSVADRVETSTEDFVDKETGKKMRRVTRITYQWAEDVPRHHGDGEGWSGWVESQRVTEVSEA